MIQAAKVIWWTGAFIFVTFIQYILFVARSAIGGQIWKTL